jgi:hypothetical protein
MRPRLLLPALAAVILVSGCGGGSSGNGIDKLSGAKALERVKAATGHVKSVHVTGTISTNGDQLEVDVRLAQDKGAGTMRIGGGEVEVRRIGTTVYVNGDEKGYEGFGADADKATAAAGKWLKSDQAGGPLSSFSSFLDLKSLFGALLTPDGPVRAGDSTTINGRKALALIDTKSAGGRLYVAETGDPVPLRIQKTGADAGRIDFTDYGETVDVQAPDGAVDISQLG